MVRGGVGVRVRVRVRVRLGGDLLDLELGLALLLQSGGGVAQQGVALAQVERRALLR